MLIDIQSLRKTFPGAAHPVLAGVKLSLAAGETLALTGESGSGKSTLLHIVGALEPFDDGIVRVAGTDLNGLDDTGAAMLRRTQLGIVFQQFNLIPSLDVVANITFQARLADRFDDRWTDALIDQLRLDDHRSKFPEELSGGQQQRVAIGRALAARPELILADEPTGNLDEDTGDAVIELMLDLSAEAGAGLMMVTHSERLAARLSRRVHLSHGILT
ncbi:MAG: ABC transporter ATP-binding protein [Pseudomonadota bacterium]